MKLAQYLVDADSSLAEESHALDVSVAAFHHIVGVDNMAGPLLGFFLIKLCYDFDGPRADS